MCEAVAVSLPEILQNPLIFLCGELDFFVDRGRLRPMFACGPKWIYIVGSGAMSDIDPKHQTWTAERLAQKHIPPALFGRRDCMSIIDGP